MESIDTNKKLLEEKPGKDVFKQETFFKLPSILPNSSTRTPAKTDQSELNLSQNIADKEARQIYSPNDQCSDKLTDVQNVYVTSDHKSSSTSSVRDSNISKESEILRSTGTSEETEKSEAQNQKTGIINPIPYKEPPWGGIAPPLPENGTSLYTLEELKNGRIVSSHPLSKSYQTVGRLPSCDIQLEHPSLSRYHAVLQFKANGSIDKPAGFYLYDLDSTHGTFHNKNQCFPKTYYRLRVGHMMKFGGSTRLLILQGPQEDTEVESELSATELKELAAEKARKRQEKIMEEKEKIESEETTGISWGIAEDAVEDENEELTLGNLPNPYSTQPEHGNLNLNDPKKTLRGWFEREGYDLEYDCQEIGYAKFKCTVKLPIEDENGERTEVLAEATVSGKKKEAVVNCALEACRILDKRGLLRSSTHERRAKKSAKKWVENDYYDSDEDEFLDRTGALQAKRQKRMKTVNNYNRIEEHPKEVEHSTAENFESLTKKHIIVSTQILKLQQRIQAAKQSMQEINGKTRDAGDDEDLDAYMAVLERSADCSKEEVAKLKIQLSELTCESRKLERLIEIARPAKMPELKSSNSESSVKIKPGSILIGKMFGKGVRKMKPIIPNSNTKALPNAILPAKVEAVAKNTIPVHFDKQKEEKTSVLLIPQRKIPEGDKESQTLSSLKIETLNQGVKSSSNTPTMIPSEHDNQNTTTSVCNTHTEKYKNSEQVKPISSKKQRKNNKSIRNVLEENIRSGKPYEEVSEHDERYSTWLPPKNQIGDGKTSLNDKYGY